MRMKVDENLGRLAAELLRGSGHDVTSVITSKAAMHDRVKTGHVRPSGTRLFYPACSPSGKPVFVRQLLGPHFSRCPW